jgi:hypothetical protein
MARRENTVPGKSNGGASYLEAPPPAAVLATEPVPWLHREDVL